MGKENQRPFAREIETETWVPLEQMRRVLNQVNEHAAAAAHWQRLAERHWGWTALAGFFGFLLGFLLGLEAGWWQ